MGVGAEKRQCLSPASFSAHRKLAQICPKPARNPSPGQGCYPTQKEVTQRLTRANKGYFCAGALWGTQQAGGSRCARLQRASASSCVAAPLGCVTLFVIWRCYCFFTLCAGLSAQASTGGDITTLGKLHVVETLGACLSKRLTCRFPLSSEHCSLCMGLFSCEYTDISVGKFSCKRFRVMVR